jgi:hypothetical protein
MQAESVAATAIRASNAAIFALEGVSSLLPSIQDNPDAAGNLKQAGTALELAKSAVWDSLEVNLRQLDSVQRQRRSLWLDSANLNKEIASFAKSRPLPPGSVSDRGTIVPPVMCGQQLAEYIKASSQMKKNLDHALGREPVKRKPTYREAPQPYKRGRGSRGASGRGASTRTQSQPSAKETKEETKSFRGKSNTSTRGRSQRGRSAKF